MLLEAGKDKLRRWHFQNTNTYRIPEIHTKTFLSKSLWQNRDQQLKWIMVIQCELFEQYENYTQKMN